MQYNLNLAQAIYELELEANTLEEPMLDGIDAQTIYQLGFATAVKHLREMTGPDPFTAEVITVQLPEGAEFGPFRPGDDNEPVSLLPTISEKKNSEDDNA